MQINLLVSMGVSGMNDWGWRRWLWVAVGRGELHLHLHTGGNATLQHFLLHCSPLGSAVFALLSGFTSARPPVVEPTPGCEDTQTLSALSVLPGGAEPCQCQE